MGQHYNVRDLVYLESSFGECYLFQISQFSNQKRNMKYAKVIKLATRNYFFCFINKFAENAPIWQEDISQIMAWAWIKTQHLIIQLNGGQAVYQPA